MNTSHTIPIFKAGRHADMNGTTLEITNDDLERTVAAYDPAVWKAPLVIGHPRHDAPAWGWVASLARQGETLLATLTDLAPDMIAFVAEGRYRNVSASFYTPEAPGNPGPGVFYLRHVGLLGAQPPAIKGLPQVSFQEAVDPSACAVGSGVPTPAAWTATPPTQASPTREPLMPEPNEHLDRSRQRTPQQACFAAQPPVPTGPRDATENKEEQPENAPESPGQNRQKTAEFVDALIAEGRILPRYREGLLAFMTFLADSGMVAFGEDQGQMGFLKRFLRELPRQVDYAERSLAAPGGTDAIRFQLPHGYAADPASLEMHGRILAYARANRTDYLTAALAVSA